MPERTIQINETSPLIDNPDGGTIVTKVLPDQEEIEDTENDALASSHTDTVIELGYYPSIYSIESDPSAEVFLGAGVRHRLRNYVESVLFIFSPWIYQPLHGETSVSATLSSAGIELEVIGYAPPSRRALLQSILTISAYHLRNVNSSNQEVAMRWGHAEPRCWRLAII